MNVTKTEKNLIIVATFIVLYASTSYFCKNAFSETKNVCLMIIGLLPLVFVKKVVLKRNVLIAVLLLMLSSIGSSLLAHDDSKLIVYPCVTLLVAFLYVLLVPLDEFKSAFAKIMVVVAALSVVVYGIYIILPGFIERFPLITNTSGNSAYNLFLVVVTPRHLYRAEGFFWEPGAFQTFINLAIPIVAFSNSFSHKRTAICILYFALFLTFSTTAWLVGILNAFTILLGRKSNGKNRLVNLAIILSIMIPVLLVGVQLLPNTLGGATFGMEKIRAFLRGTSKNTFDSSSVRFDSVYYPLFLFFKNPLTGAGYSGMTDLSNIMLHNMLTCTPINYFAMYGVLYGSVIMLCFMYYCKTFQKGRLITLLLFICLLLSMFSEQYVNYAIIDIFIIFGLSYLIERNWKYDCRRD